MNELLKEEFHSSGGYLRVVPHEDDKGASFQHTLIGVPSKVEVHEGEKAVLECITNDEDPILEWSRIGGLSYRETLYYQSSFIDLLYLLCCCNCLAAYFL